MSGSVRYSTLVELAERSDNAALAQQLRPPRDLDECFRVFAILHKLITNTALLEQVTRRVLDDFRADNCVYLELRTTPRCIRDNDGRVLVSKLEYLNAIISAIEKFENETNGKIIFYYYISDFT